MAAPCAARTAITWSATLRFVRTADWRCDPQENAIGARWRARSRPVHRARGARRLHPLWLAAVAVALGACGLGAIPIPNATPTPCAGTCPPPMGPAGSPHTVRTSYFTFTYYDPWTVQSSDASGTQLVASTQ